MTEQARLACERCKRYKKKCDRQLPKCRNCLKPSESCVYPTVSRKPGPKPGWKKLKPISQVARAPSLPASNSPKRVDINQTSEIEKNDARQSVSRGLALSHLLQPTHEPLTESHRGSLTPNGVERQSNDIIANHLCHAFEIPLETYHSLISSYFQHMTSFSLFHTPTFDKKIAEVRSSLHVQALISGMFSFSARFKDSIQTPAGVVASPQKFYDLAQRLIGESLEQCLDETPPLCLLQALVLTTFYQLTSGVRGRAWRSIGTCVQIAYELRLHMVDRQGSNPALLSPETPVEEEKRRAWWAIWEFDVYGSTILRLPTAIAWEHNETWLPVEDDSWFSNSPSRSCRLHPDPTISWKNLQESGNKSAKAWLIVTNALMRCAHLLSYPQAYLMTIQCPNIPGREESQARLEVIANSLYCLTVAIPPSVAYQGEFLNFTTTIQHDSERHSIYLMIQLSRFMIHHRQVFDSTSRRLELVGSYSPTSQSLSPASQGAWHHYLAAASDVVALVRSCSPKHVQYVCPFLFNVVWLAAAAQVVSKDFGPAFVDQRVADSNRDLLRVNLDDFVSTWGISSNLSQKLTTLELRLKDFLALEQRTSLQNQNSEQENLQPMNMQGIISKQTAMNSLTNQIGDQGTTTSYLLDSRWSQRQDLGFSGGPSPNTEGSELWGWGIDELLSYGGA